MTDSPGARPPKLPFPTTRVIKALPVRALSSGRKLVWLELFNLDSGGPDGCFIGATPLARRLGVSADMVEQDRRELLRVGLLQTVPRGRRRTASWYPCLPVECIPVCDRPADAEIVACAERLAQRLTGVAEQAPPVRRRPAGLSGGAGSATRAGVTGGAGSANRPPTGGAGSATSGSTGGAGSAGGVPDWRSVLRPGGFQPLLKLETTPTSEVGPVNAPEEKLDRPDTIPGTGAAQVLVAVESAGAS